MNLRHVPLLIAASALASLAHADEQPLSPEPIQVAQATPAGNASMTSPTPPVVHGTRRGALAAAALGPDALRRYILITQPIYGYRFEDYAKPDWYR